MELYDDLSPDIIGSGSFQDVMTNLVYKYVTLNGRSFSTLVGFKSDFKSSIKNKTQASIKNNSIIWIQKIFLLLKIWSIIKILLVI